MFLILGLDGKENVNHKPLFSKDVEGIPKQQNIRTMKDIFCTSIEANLDNKDKTRTRPPSFYDLIVDNNEKISMV